MCWCCSDPWSQWASIISALSSRSSTQHINVRFRLCVASDMDEEPSSLVRVHRRRAASHCAARLQRGRRWNATGSTANTHWEVGTRTARGQAGLQRWYHGRRTSVDLEHTETCRICDAGRDLLRWLLSTLCYCQWGWHVLVALKPAIVPVSVHSSICSFITIVRWYSSWKEEDTGDMSWHTILRLYRAKFCRRMRFTTIKFDTFWSKK